ncbi:prepilin peptidase [Methylosinus sporium]|uniref:Protein translocase subunit SecA n=2 Tax=Methylosinus sporium TaxID=428 RepID=A0A2U1SLZ4_METSR|nr:DEAD/DEAH box helicase [Methylosinus sporium]PWB92639.1 prepilin peptidase [Methylosinus sporium]
MSDVSSPASRPLPRPCLYPERRWPRSGPLEQAAEAMAARLAPQIGRLEGRAAASVVERVAAHEAAALRAASDAELRALARGLREKLHHCRARDPDAIAEAFAVIREASDRVLGMRHFDVQLIGGNILLGGMIAEMDTGEGKTLTATLAAATAALAGVPTHVVTANDYLARRDAEQMRPLYEFLGLRVGVATQEMEAAEKRAAYACEIAYCTNKTLAFDYLRDRLTLGRRSGNLRRKLENLVAPTGRTHELLLRGLHFAIVDEADSILIDEARTPLILSRELSPAFDRETFVQALEIAGRMREGRDYRIGLVERRVDLTAAGRTFLGELAEPFGGAWRAPSQREEWALQAIVASRLFRRDEHYIVRGGKVEIVDEYTGRVMADRFWSDGLHQMIEIKEGCALSGVRATIARMTYQRFFRRYQRLAGMTGTAAEVSSELWRVYRLTVARVPTNRPSQRVLLQERVVATEAEKWRVVVETIAEHHRRGAPVLLGTRSVASSRRASASLTAAGLPHVVLNAAQDAAEAEIVAAAGRRGRITVATNMAGRGTDIKLDADVIDLGGLHVIMSERHDARRIDRQLAGRCARQGQRGAFQAILSLDDGVTDTNALPFERYLNYVMIRAGWSWPARFALRAAQRRAERLHARMRRELLDRDETLDHALAFTGNAE